MSELTQAANAIWKAACGKQPLPDPITPNPIQRQQLDRAIAFCLKMDWQVTDFPIVVIPHAPGGLLALAEDGKIILTLGVFDMGVKTIASALYEEWIHLTLKYRDESRELQTHLFSQVIGLGERLMETAL